MDLVDIAQEREEKLRQEAILRHFNNFNKNSAVELKWPKFCIDCGSLIPFERLEAVPGAIRCCPCQKKKEKK